MLVGAMASAIVCETVFVIAMIFVGAIVSILILVENDAQL